MELSTELKKLEPLPSALDIIRVLGKTDDALHADEIIDTLDISDRRFKKAIRRLSTVGYTQMGMQQEYRLTEMGQQAAEELAEYDKLAPLQDEVIAESKVKRHVTITLPDKLVVGRTVNLTVGIAPAAGKKLVNPADVVLRTTVINAHLNTTDDAMLSVEDDAVQHVYHLTAGNRSLVRVKVQVFQLDPSGEDITKCGGLYVDIETTTDPSESSPAAYGSDILLDQTG